MYNGKNRHIQRRYKTIRQLISRGIITIDYLKSKDNVSDPLTKGLTRDDVERSLKKNGPRTSSHGGNSTQKAGDPKIQVQGAQTKLCMTAPTLSNNITLPLNQTIFSTKDKPLKIFFNDYLSLIRKLLNSVHLRDYTFINHLCECEVDAASRRICKENSLCTHEPGLVHG